MNVKEYRASKKGNFRFVLCILEESITKRKDALILCAAATVDERTIPNSPCVKATLERCSKVR